MIRPPNDLAEVYVCTEPVDFRKQINGLAELVEGELALDPFSAKIFAFTNRRRDRCKLLVWERTGFLLWQNQLSSYCTSCT
jgi:transposase